MFAKNIQRFRFCGVLIAMVASAASADIVIDTYERGPLMLSDSSTTANPSLSQGAAPGLTTADVIKAVRHVTLNTSGSGADAAQLKLELIHSDNGIEMISNVAVSEVHYILSYSGFFGFPHANNLNIDFSGQQGFLLTFDRVDFAIAATLRVYSNVPMETTFAIATVIITKPGTYFVDYDDFDDFDILKDFGWSNVRRLNVDFNISGLETLGTNRLTDFRAGFDPGLEIPEPATSCLLMTALLAFHHRRSVHSR